MGPWFESRSWSQTIFQEQYSKLLKLKTRLLAGFFVLAGHRHFLAEERGDSRRLSERGAGMLSQPTLPLNTAK
ncbi:hypothetical protein ALO83_103688 [Pseudomonas cannabina pv. alisalensis]|uniref:Uncharacterized protein n=1 Tax=Pseudomonas cannabina TaxID=86840 RepID=A0A3M3Q0X1_PSECA|nr:hypothetical protein ALO83_103688 [Pseudomonas cannabina pv. alisalensis]RMN77891.1 hypothetical protein ALQ53_103446 [Pseudomonas cannabina]RMN88098.1 hypothetical protein ALQ52_104355 [Pseudomonas cannabina pv. alisalensis]RMN93427.1 hypothetical protein ALQ51_102142 [Pseudomonas cannabina]